MSLYFKNIPGRIKFICVIDRDNNPVLFFNVCDEEMEFKFELITFSSLDFLNENVVNLNKNNDKNDNNNSDYLGLLTPFYENEIDLGSYGYVGKNGIKICLIKELDNNNIENDKKIENICKEIFNKFNKLLLNPFFDKNEFNNKESKQKEKFCNNIFELISQEQIKN